MTDDRLARAAELRSIAEMLGISINELGRRCGVDDSNFRRFTRQGESGRRATDEVMLAARGLLDQKAVDDFIVGYGDASGQRYVIHTTEPKCVAIMASRDRIERVVWQNTSPNKAIRERLEDAILKASLRGYHRDYHAR